MEIAGEERCAELKENIAGGMDSGAGGGVKGHAQLGGGRLSRWTSGFLPTFSVELVEQVLGSEVCILPMSSFSNDSFAQAAFGVHVCVCVGRGRGRTYVEKLPRNCSYQARGRGRRKPNSVQCASHSIPTTIMQVRPLF